MPDSNECSELVTTHEAAELGTLHLELNPGHRLMIGQRIPDGGWVIACSSPFYSIYAYDPDSLGVIDVSSLQTSDHCTFHVHLLPGEEREWLDDYR